jgi:hypothetical protein
MHGCSKHIDMCFHFLRELTKDETIQLVHCSILEQVVDVMTKALKLDTFVKPCKLIKVCLLMDVN